MSLMLCRLNRERRRRCITWLSFDRHLSLRRFRHVFLHPNMSQEAEHQQADEVDDSTKLVCRECACDLVGGHQPLVSVLQIFEYRAIRLTKVCPPTLNICDFFQRRKSGIAQTWNTTPNLQALKKASEKRGLERDI